MGTWHTKTKYTESIAYLRYVYSKTSVSSRALDANECTERQCPASATPVNDSEKLLALPKYGHNKVINISMKIGIPKS
jgi:hypothetical protein